jgi:hypothetical protein
MKGQFFGDFLLGKGVINQEQLDEAIRYQDENNVLLGDLAVRRGLLTREQLVGLLHSAGHLHLKLGQAMIDQGFLDETTLHELLALQANNHAYLGASLVRLGHLQESELLRHLETFQAVAQINESNVRASLASGFAGDFFPLVIEASKSFFYRFGYLCKVVAVEDVFPDVKESSVFAVEQKHAKGGTHFLCFALPDEFVVQIGQHGGQDSGNARGYETLYEDVSQHLFNLNYAICTALRNQGRKVQYDAIMRGIPNHGECRSARLNTILGTIHVAMVR